MVGCIPTTSAWISFLKGGTSWNTPVRPCWEWTLLERQHCCKTWERKQILRTWLCVAHTGFLFTIWACVPGSQGFLNFHFIVNQKPIQLSCSQYGHRTLVHKGSMLYFYVALKDGPVQFFCSQYGWGCFIGKGTIRHFCTIVNKEPTQVLKHEVLKILFPEFGYNIYSFQ